MPDSPRLYRIEGTEADFTLHTTSDIGVKKLEAPPIELAAGSGLDIRATVMQFDNPKIESVVDLSIEESDVIATIESIIELEVT